METKPSANTSSTKSGGPSEAVAAPTLMPRRLFHQHGVVNRRKVLAAATSGIVGVILGERLLAPLRAEAQPRGLLPWLSGGGAVAAPETGAGGGAGGGTASATVDLNKARLASPGILGDYIWLTPTKLGGGAQVQDLSTGKTLAWIEYWNYGDSCPIAHHLAAFPSPDPRKGFEFVNTTQGGQNVLIYGIPSQLQEHGMLDPLWGQGNQIYRVGFDGNQMNLLENVAETTGIGVGVHTVIYPDATGFSGSDGQKDVVAFFTRASGTAKTQVIAAFRFDWYGKETDGTLERNWFGGGKVRVTKLVAAPETGKYDYRGTKGQQARLGNGSDGRVSCLYGPVARGCGPQPHRRRQYGASSRQPLLDRNPANVRRRRRHRSNDYGTGCLHLRARGVAEGQHPCQEGRRRYLGDRARQRGHVRPRVRV